MLKKKINFVQNQHILNVDLIQKYKLQNKNQIPEIKEIFFLLDLNDFSNLLNISEEILQIYSFFNLYSLGFMFPKVQIYKYGNTALSSKGFKLKLSIKNQADIKMFLEYIFIFLIEKQDDIQKLKIKKWESNFDLTIPLTKTLTIGVNEKPLFNTSVSFIFNKKEIKKKYIFSQFPPLWILRLNG